MFFCVYVFYPSSSYFQILLFSFDTVVVNMLLSRFLYALVCCCSNFAKYLCLIIVFLLFFLLFVMASYTLVCILLCTHLGVYCNRCHLSFASCPFSTFSSRLLSVHFLFCSLFSLAISNCIHFLFAFANPI